MVWVAIPAVVIALVAVHELAVYALARRLGGEPHRRVAIVFVRGPRRAAIALAGAAAVAYVVVCALAGAFYVDHGIETGGHYYRVAAVEDGFDAAGKLQPGDRIVAIDGDPLWVERTSLVERVNAKAGAPVTLSIERNGARLDVVVQPTRGRDHWLLGIRPGIAPEMRHDTGEALVAALAFPAWQVQALAHELRASITPVSADPGGPKRIYDSFAVDDNGVRGWGALLRLSVVVALLLVGLDLVRAAGLLVPRRA